MAEQSFCKVPRVVLRTGDFAYVGSTPLVKPGQSAAPLAHQTWGLTVTDARTGTTYLRMGGSAVVPDWWLLLRDRSIT